MCEYCEKPKDMQFKTIMDSMPIDASLFIDGRHCRYLKHTYIQSLNELN